MGFERWEKFLADFYKQQGNKKAEKKRGGSPAGDKGGLKHGGNDRSGKRGKAALQEGMEPPKQRQGEGCTGALLGEKGRDGRGGRGRRTGTGRKNEP